jgi:acetyltransferase-like isoleucine patch superfamily enzyme
MGIRIGERCKLGKFEILGYGDIVIGDEVIIRDGVKINVSEKLSIGDRSELGENFVLNGRDIYIGREFWSGRNCGIGGGSCFEKTSQLYIGDMCHLGDFGFINTARPVFIADEVGLGQETKIYTHGAYESFMKGFPVEFGPVTIGERVWCPKAIIMPNVTIGHDTVVGAGAIVTKDLPCGCLAVGMPAKVIKENVYPRSLSEDEFKELLNKFLEHFRKDIWTTTDFEIRVIDRNLFLNGRLTLFDFKDMRIDGAATELTEKFRSELRRWGVRFRYYPKEGMYVKW